MSTYTKATDYDREIYDAQERAFAPAHAPWSDDALKNLVLRALDTCETRVEVFVQGTTLAPEHGVCKYESWGCIIVLGRGSSPFTALHEAAHVLGGATRTGRPTNPGHSRAWYRAFVSLLERFFPALVSTFKENVGPILEEPQLKEV